MQNEHGVDFHSLYGDIYIASYPNQRLVEAGSYNNDRSIKLLQSRFYAKDKEAALKTPGRFKKD